MSEIYHLKSRISKLEAENATLRACIKNDCKNEELIKKLVKPYLTPFEINGDSYGVPGVVEILETLCQKLAEAKKDTERLNWLSTHYEITICKATFNGSMKWWLDKITPHNELPDSIRNAIDAAMQQKEQL